MKALMGFSLVFASVAAMPLASADERPPADGTPLFELLEILDEKGYGPVIEVSFDDGVWEVEVYKGDAALEVSVDPAKGEIISEHRDDGDPKPPTDAMPLAKVIAALERAGYTDLNDISFERRSWEVEATRDNQKIELRVDAKDGRVISDRVDD
jgi:uncharacterized membrane protein YkoI